MSHPWHTVGTVHGNGGAAVATTADRLAPLDAAQRAWLDDVCRREREAKRERARMRNAAKETSRCLTPTSAP